MSTTCCHTTCCPIEHVQVCHGSSALPTTVITLSKIAALAPSRSSLSPHAARMNLQLWEVVCAVSLSYLVFWWANPFRKYSSFFPQVRLAVFSVCGCQSCTKSRVSPFLIFWHFVLSWIDDRARYRSRPVRWPLTLYERFQYVSSCVHYFSHCLTFMSPWLGCWVYCKALDRDLATLLRNGALWSMHIVGDGEEFCPRTFIYYMWYSLEFPSARASGTMAHLHHALENIALCLVRSRRRRYVVLLDHVIRRLCSTRAQPYWIWHTQSTLTTTYAKHL